MAFSLARAAEVASLWRNRHFLLLWLAQAISQTAQNAIWYGIVVLVEQRTHSTAQLSVAVLTLIVPSVIFGVVAGVYVDRWDKRLVLVATNVLRGGVAFAYVAYAANSTFPLALLFVVNFAFTTIGQFFAPAEAAIIPGIVPRARLLQANALFHLTFTASQLAGLVLLGPLIAKLAGAEGIFAAMAVAIVACGALVWPLPSQPPAHRGVVAPRMSGTGDAVTHRTGRDAIYGVWQDVRVVGSFVFSNRVVALALIQWTLGAILGLVVATLLPGFGQRLLRVRPEDAVFVLAPAGVGMVVGTALLNRWGQLIDKHFLAKTGLWVIAVCLGTIGGAAMLLEVVLAGNIPLIDLPVLGEVSGLVPLVMALALVAGFGFVAVMVPTQTYLQEQAPAMLRGRVFAVQQMLANLASILPLLVLGGLADLIGADRTLLLIGALIAVAGVVSGRIAPGRPPWRQ